MEQKLPILNGHRSIYTTGLDATRPTNPGKGDVYFATDTGRSYVCYIPLFWSSIAEYDNSYWHATYPKLTIVQGAWTAYHEAATYDFDPELINPYGKGYDTSSLSNSVAQGVSADGDEIHFGNVNLIAGTYKVTVSCVANSQRGGILEVLHDTTSLGFIDLFTTGEVQTTWTYAPTVWVSGNIRVKVTGKNAGSTGYNIRLLRLEIIRVDASPIVVAHSSTSHTGATANVLAGLTPTFTNWTQDPGTVAKIVAESGTRILDSNGIGASGTNTIHYDLGSLKRRMVYLYESTAKSIIDFSTDDSNYYTAINLLNSGGTEGFAMGYFRYLNLEVAGILTITQLRILCYDIN